MESNTEQPVAPVENQSATPAQKSPSKPFPNMAIVLIAVLILLALAAGAFVFQSKNKKTATQISSTVNPTMIQSSQTRKTEPMTNWKIYKGNSYGISYPQDWIYDPSFQGLNAVSGTEGFIILSPDYHHGASGAVDKGAVIRLSIYSQPFSRTLGLISTENITWLGQKARLQVYKFEGDDLVLTTQFNNSTYELLMTVADDMTRDRYKQVFLQIANTLQLSK